MNFPERNHLNKEAFTTWQLLTVAIRSFLSRFLSLVFHGWEVSKPCFLSLFQLPGAGKKELPSSLGGKGRHGLSIMCLFFPEVYRIPGEDGRNQSCPPNRVHFLQSHYTATFTIALEFYFEYTLRCAASFYFSLSWQPNISSHINWEYNSTLIVLCQLVTFCLCYSALLQKGINLNYMMLWLSPWRELDFCTPWVNNSETELESSSLYAMPLSSSFPFTSLWGPLMFKLDLPVLLFFTHWDFQGPIAAVFTSFYLRDTSTDEGAFLSLNIMLYV
jgi:hypothetical protein